MYSPFVMVLGNLISGVLFLLDEYTTSVHDYLSILTGCSLIFFPLTQVRMCEKSLKEELNL